MRTFAPLVLIALTAACTASAEDATPSGDVQNRTFDVSGFDRVALEGSDSVKVMTGGAFAVRATGDRVLLDQLDIRVEGGKLRIGRKRDRSFNWNRGGAAIAVTLPALAGASVSGSGDMTVDAVKTSRFGGSVSGSGDLDIAALEAEQADLSVAGSGDLSVAGSARALKLSVAGSGDIKGNGLASETAKISVAGSGNVAAGVSRAAEVSIVGSGDVEIIGGAACTVSKVGSGDVRCTPGAAR